MLDCLQKVKKPFIIFILSLSLVFSQVGLATSSEAEALEYVSLGDSITIGFEPGMTLETVPYGFVDRLYEQALYYGRTNLNNYGLGGLKSSGLKNFLQAIYDQEVVSAMDIQANLPDPRVEQYLQQLSQLKQVIENADLISVTIGGNDLREALPILTNDQEVDIEEFSAEMASELQKNVSACIDLIYLMNPKVKIMIANQYQPFPEIVNKEMYQKLNLLSHEWSQVLSELVQENQAEGRDIQMVNIAEPFVKKELAYTHINKMDIHPNQTGYEVIARVFAEKIWGQYQMPKYTEPLAIVFAGKELEISLKPILINGTTYLPIRDYIETLGAQVIYDGKNKKTIVFLNDKKASFDIEEKLYTSDLEKTSYKGDVLIYNSKTYVSLRAVAEKLNFDVKYISKSKTVFINP